MIIQTLSALLTPLIAISTAYVAYQQWKLARRKWRLDLYDKRFETYRVVTAFISLICRQGKWTDDEWWEFIRAANRNEFLFGAEVRGLIEQLRVKALRKTELEATIQTMLNEPNPDGRKRLAEEARETADWFGKQFDVAKALFGEYLSITER